MIERAIENWLTETNERNFQIPFCQLLLCDGHSVVYVSKHRPMEQGKDIISIDSAGDIHAYQLKTGDIDLKVWREIRGEIRELIELPIVHPSIEKSKPYRAYLVTNGEITDEVRIQIDQINEDNKRKSRGYAHLDLVTKGTLVAEFIKKQGRFLPSSPKDFKGFLKLFNTDGKAFLEKTAFFEFLSGSVFSRLKSRSDFKHAISSSVIITSYALSEYQREENNYACFEAWLVLASFIQWLAYEHSLQRIHWISSFDLAMMSAERHLEALKVEALNRPNFLEGSIIGDGGSLYRHRLTLVLGTLAAYENYTAEREPSYQTEAKLVERIASEATNVIFWGESAFPCFFHLIRFLERTGKEDIAKELLAILWIILLKEYGLRKFGHFTPYCELPEILSFRFDSNSRTPTLLTKGSSYMARSVLEMFARRRERAVIENAWKRITKVVWRSFRFSAPHDAYLYRTVRGFNAFEVPQPQQSWKTICTDAGRVGVPRELAEQKALWNLLILVYPFRADHLVLRMLDLAPVS